MKLMSDTRLENSYISELGMRTDSFSLCLQDAKMHLTVRFEFELNR